MSDTPTVTPTEVLQPVANAIGAPNNDEGMLVGLNTIVASPQLAEKDIEKIEALPVVVPNAPRVRAAVTVASPLANPLSEVSKAMAEINKTFGANTVMIGSKVPSFNQLSTGVFVLDYGLFGGFHEGLASMYFGWENVGKTSMLLRAIKSFQDRYPGKVTAIVALEGTLDPDHARLFGVDLDKVVVAMPGRGEHAVDAFMELYKSQEVGLVCLDSVPALVPSAIVEKSAEDATMAEGARLFTKLCQKLLTETNTQRQRGHIVTVLFTNQWRIKPGFVMGDARYIPGGNFQKFYVTNMIEIKAKNHTGDDTLQQEVLSHLEQGFNLRKTKVGASLKEGEFISIISNDHPSGLAPGEIEEHGVVATYAKRHGFITGGGGKIRMIDVEQPFRVLDDLKAYLRDPKNVAYYTGLKQRVIADLRVRKGRTAFPPDGHLMGKPKLY